MKATPIDHIVYCVPNLELAINFIESKIGIRPSIGGRHLSMGTKNALLDLDNKMYLEILSIDEENKDYTNDRWMGIDLIEEATITRWALKSTSIKEDSKLLAAIDPDLGLVKTGERKLSRGDTLKWSLSMPGPKPKVDILPFLIDWSQSKEHPTSSLPKGCILNSISVSHPNPEKYREAALSLFPLIPIKQHSIPSIQVSISGLNGKMLHL